VENESRLEYFKDLLSLRDKKYRDGCALLIHDIFHVLTKAREDIEKIRKEKAGIVNILDKIKEVNIYTIKY